MKKPKQTLVAEQVLSQVSKWGFPPDVLQRFGAFAVMWSIFESNLEKAIWVLNSENVSAKRPSTDKTPVSDWIDNLGAQRTMIPAEINKILNTASKAAYNLMEYRHALMHGSLLPFNQPFFIRNPRWHGEVRKRPTHDAHVSVNLLDMALDSVWTLSRIVICLSDNTSLEKKLEKIVALKTDVSRAYSLANELRHLSSMVNHEKY